MRVIAGALRGKKLSQPSGRDIRPTSDKMRESVFNILGRRVQGARVLDLFAGTGALGIEALSRGAAFAVFLDHSGPAVRLIEKNLTLCGLSDRARIFKWDISRTLYGLRSAGGFDLVFLDPPYGKDLLPLAIRHLEKARVLEKNAILVAEHGLDESPAPPSAFVLFDQRRYGKSLVSFLEYDMDGIDRFPDNDF